MTVTKSRMLQAERSASGKTDLYIDRPVVLLGRGGSGTRILSEAAQCAGIFLGNDINVSGDSVEWVKPIYRLAIKSCEGQKTNPKWRRRLRAHARNVLEGGACAQAQPWGWKLPETMLILPAVLDAFPAARVVHLVRHPVTMSLRRTHITSRLNNPVGRAVLDAAYRDICRPIAKIETDQEWQHNAISWLYQVRRVMQQGCGLIAPGSFMQQRFEDLCAEPEDGLERIVRFLGQDSGQLRESSAGFDFAGRIDPNRACGETSATMRDTASRASWIWSLCGSVAEDLGYDPTPPIGGEASS